MNCRKCGVALPEKAAFCPACGVKQAVSARKPKRRGNGQGTVVKRGKTYTAICTKFIAGKTDHVFKRRICNEKRSAGLYSKP